MISRDPNCVPRKKRFKLVFIPFFLVFPLEAILLVKCININAILWKNRMKIRGFCKSTDNCANQTSRTGVGFAKGGLKINEEWSDDLKVSLVQLYDLLFSVNYIFFCKCIYEMRRKEKERKKRNLSLIINNIYCQEYSNYSTIKSIISRYYYN